MDILKSIQHEFEGYKKGNEGLHLTELSFEAAVDNPGMNEQLDIQQNPILTSEPNSKAAVENPEGDSSSRFSLGVPPIQRSQPSLPIPPIPPTAPVPDPDPESLVDRQMMILMSKLTGIVNKER